MSPSSSTVSAPTSTPSPTYAYTPCMASCLRQATLATGCLNENCVCAGDFVANAIPCLRANCTSADLDSTFALWASSCGTGSAILATESGLIFTTGGATSSTTTATTSAGPTRLSFSTAPSSSNSSSSGPLSSASSPPRTSDGAPVDSSSHRPALALVVALPVILGVGVLASAVFLVLRRRRRQRFRRHASSPVSPFQSSSTDSGSGFDDALKNEPDEAALGEPHLPASTVTPSHLVLYRTASHSLAELDSSTEVQAGSTFPQPIAQPDPQLLIAHPRAHRRKSASLPSFAATRPPSHLSPSSQNPLSPPPCPLPHPIPRPPIGTTHIVGEHTATADPPTRERVLVLPWALGQRLLAMAGAGTLPRDMREGSVDVEPPPAYDDGPPLSL
ncbi:hypothetical protein BC628DRAFT_138178 [Trametes gibbosa]|nr:hypothetical protein BC628DRAFT_138178 [Trametes gibbosa]